MSLPTLLRLRGLAAGTCLATCAPLLAQSADLDAWTVRVGTDHEFVADVTGTPGAPFALVVTDRGESIGSPEARVLARGAFAPDGRAQVILPIQTTLPASFGVSVHLATRDLGVLDIRSQELALMGSGGTLCQEFDPDFALGDTEPVPGQTLDTQWDLVGMTVSATNNVPSHPQRAITFDSSTPTGGDTDLATPGYGPGNNVAYGQLIIVPENDVDVDADGLVDEPDDEEFGGVIRFDFDDPYRMCSATLVDIDDSAPSELRFYTGPGLDLQTIPVAFQGDNGVQTLTFDVRDVRRFEVVLGGSGGLAELQMVPCPMVLNLDETPFGKPVDVGVGEWITDQFATLGVEVSATNNVPMHPDKAITFDSENPTGDDFDLMTPGPGIGNNTPLGKVLIIAENDVDMDGDGLVDDPDDEEFGGQIVFDFSEPVTFFSTQVLDVDAMERDIFIFFDENGVQLDFIEIGALGENSVQLLQPAVPISGVKQIVVNLTGSGAFSRLRWCPESNVGTPAVN